MKIITDSAIYSVAQVGRGAIGFLLVPLYTRYLSTSDYGTVATIVSFIGLLSVFSNWQLHGAGCRFWFEYDEAANEQGQLICAVVSGIALISTALIIVLAVTRQFWMNIMLSGISYWPFIITALISVWVAQIGTFFMAYLQTLRRARLFAVCSIGQILVSILTTIYLVAGLKLGALGLLLGNLIGCAVITAVALVFFWRRIVWRLNKELMKRCFEYATPFVPHALAGWGLTQADRMLVNTYLGNSEAGIYSLAVQMASLIGILATGINQAYQPWFFRNVNRGEAARKKIRNFAEVTVIFLGLIATGLSLFIGDIMAIIATPSYFGASKVVAPLALSFVASSGYYFLSSPLFYDAPKRVPIVTGLSVCISLFANLLLIHYFGVYGAAMGTMIGWVASGVCANWLAKDLSSHCLGGSKLIAMVVIFCAGGSITTFYSVKHDCSFLFRVCALGAFAIYIPLIWIKTLPAVQKSALENDFRNLKRRVRNEI